MYVYIYIITVRGEIFNRAGEKEDWNKHRNSEQGEDERPCASTK